MRFWLSAPRFMGIRPGVSFSTSELKAKQPMNVNIHGATFAPSYVYVIEGQQNCIKIGITTNPQARIAALRTGSAFPLKFAFVAQASGNAADIEREAHAFLSKYSCHGEWFDVSPELGMAAVTGAAAKVRQTLICEHPTTGSTKDLIVFKRPPFGFANCFGMIIAGIMYYTTLLAMLIAFSHEHESFTTLTYLLLMLAAWVGAYYTARPRRVRCE